MSFIFTKKSKFYFTETVETEERAALSILKNVQRRNSPNVPSTFLIYECRCKSSQKKKKIPHPSKFL